MKKLLPVVLLILSTLIGFKMFSSGALSPAAFAGISVAVMFILVLLRPKNANTQADPRAVTDALGEFGKDAFSDDSQVSTEFQAAVSDLLSSKPKAAMAKLEKLAPQCGDDAQRYAVAIVMALTYAKQNMYDRAIVEYNRAVIIHPTSPLALSIGSCQQRIGELDKAIDSYEFALELDPKNIQARSALATAWVANRDYQEALTHAELALELDSTNASSLATTAICHGLLGNSDMREQFTAKAEKQGYSRKKIDDTIKALK